MKKASLFASTGILFTLLGCSGNSRTALSPNAPVVVQAPVSPASTPPVAELAAALPVPSVGLANQQAWHFETVKDRLGNAVALKRASLDNKFDLVILRKGTSSFLSFTRHARWNSVHDQPAKGNLMYLRAKFEDGQEKRIEWDELGFATDNLYSVLWSYPAKTGTRVGPVLEGPTGDDVGGDQLFIQEMMKHKAMVLEVEPGVTTQFDLTGLARNLENVRTPQTQPILEASQTAE